MYKDPDDPRIKASRRTHYNNNKDQYYARVKAKKVTLKHFLDAVKSFPCQDCGVTYAPWIMQLDHRSGETKKYNPAQLPNRGSWRVMVEEILKCDLVCANCHADRTYKRAHHRDVV